MWVEIQTSGCFYCVSNERRKPTPLSCPSDLRTICTRLPYSSVGAFDWST